jgi:serine/threonine protein kinase
MVCFLRSFVGLIECRSAGCIFAELLHGQPILPGQSEFDQFRLIVELIGSPNEQIWPDFATLSHMFQIAHQPYNNLNSKFASLSQSGINLLDLMLTYNPARRITAQDALRHKYFNVVPLPVAQENMPRFTFKQEDALKRREELKRSNVN